MSKERASQSSSLQNIGNARLVHVPVVAALQTQVKIAQTNSIHICRVLLAEGPPPCRIKLLSEIKTGFGSFVGRWLAESYSNTANVDSQDWAHTVSSLYEVSIL